MILVNRGYTLTEHAPATYNYQFQNVPSPVSRTNIFPIDQIDPPAATTDTGYPVFLASSMAAGTLGTHTEIDCYFSWKSASGARKHDQIQNISTDGVRYDIHEIYDDGVMIDTRVNSQSPIIFAFIAEKITMGFTGSHAYEYVAEGVKLAYQYVSSGTMYVATRYLHGGDSNYNSIVLAQTGTRTQQDYLYTVSGGVT